MPAFALKKVLNDHRQKMAINLKDLGH